MTTREQIEIVAAEVAQRAHERNRWQVTLWPDGSLAVLERASDNEWSVDADGKPIPVLLTVGTGSCDCNCGCGGHYEIEADDVAAYADEIDRALGGVARA
jgi:hypothetical protein